VATASLPLGCPALRRLEAVATYCRWAALPYNGWKPLPHIAVGLPCPATAGSRCHILPLDCPALRRLEATVAYSNGKDAVAT